MKPVRLDSPSGLAQGPNPQGLPIKSSHIWAQIGPPDPLFGPLPEALLGGLFGLIQPEARSNGPGTGQDGPQIGPPRGPIWALLGGPFGGLFGLIQPEARSNGPAPEPALAHMGSQIGPPRGPPGLAHIGKSPRIAHQIQPYLGPNRASGRPYLRPILASPRAI